MREQGWQGGRGGVSQRIGDATGQSSPGCGAEEMRGREARARRTLPIRRAGKMSARWACLRLYLNRSSALRLETVFLASSSQPVRTLT